MSVKEARRNKYNVRLITSTARLGKDAERWTDEQREDELITS